MFIVCLTSCQDKPDDAVDVGKNITEVASKSQNTTTSSKAIEYSELTPFKVLSITEGLYDNRPALQVNLSLPINVNQDIAQLVRVSHAQKQVTGDWIFNKYRTVLSFPFIEPETSYQVDVDKSLFSINNKQIDKAYQSVVNTRNAEKRVKFTSQGSTLLRDSNVLPIEAINVSAVDVKFWRIQQSKYTQFLQMSYRNEIYSLENLNKIADLAYTGQFALDTEKNKRENHNLSIADIDQVQKAGLYFVTMMPADKYSYQIESTWFMSTDIGVHSRMFKDVLTVFTHQIPDAKPYAGVDVTLLDKNGAEILGTQTDENGFVEFRSPDLSNAQLLIAQKGEHFNLIRLKQAKMDLSSFDLSSRQYKPQELFLYGPRDLYRPGETVNVNALLRNDDGKLVEATPIKAIIKRPDNRVFKSFDWQGDSSAFYKTTFVVPKDALTGKWQLVATLGNSDVFEYDFSVEDFLPERLKLNLTSANGSEHLNASAKPVIKIQSDYLYGAPAANNRYDASVNVSAATRLFDGYDGYIFGAKNYGDYQLSYQIDDKKLNEKGYAELELKNQWNNATFPLQINTHVNVYESGGRPISRQFKYLVWPQPQAVGIRPAWLDNNRDFASPNGNSEVELIAIDQSGEKIDLNAVDVLLIRENNQRYWHWGDDGWSYNSGSNQVPVFNSVITIKKDTKTMVNLPLDFGNYRLEIRNQSQQLLSSYRFFSGWHWYGGNDNRAERPDEVSLAWQLDYLKADTEAELQITAPYAGTAVVTVESDHVLWKKSFAMDSQQQNILIPIDGNWKRHDLHTTVMVIRKGDMSRQHLPARSIGVIHMPFDRQDRKIDINIDHPQKMLPDSTVVVNLSINDYDANKPVYATLAAVDTGVLNVSNFDTPDPFEWFFAKRGYQAALRDIYGSIIALSDGKNAKQKFGGDQDLNRGGDAPSSEVQIVSYLSNKITFDDKGQAQVSIDVPYFNGELRLMALAFNDDQFSAKQSLMKVAAPVVISASMPRFMAIGDQSSATIDVHNTEKTEQSIVLNLSVDDALGSYQKQVNLTLAAQQKKILSVPLNALVHNGQGSITVIAQVEDGTTHEMYEMNKSWQLGIRPAFPAVTDSMTHVLTAGGRFDSNDGMLDKFDEKSLKSILKVSNTPVLNADEHFKDLIQYPYGCLEQTSSRAWPLLGIEESDYRLLGDDKGKKIFNERHQLIDGAISRILGMQRYDGSFGLWNNNSREEKWLTSYAMDFLLNAQKMGYGVPKSALDKAIKRMKSYIRSTQRVSSDLAQYLSHKGHYQLSYKAYAAYILASTKNISLQDVRQLYDKQHLQAKSALPLAHLAMALELMGDQRRANEAWLKAFDFSYETKGYLGDYGSQIRDLSQVARLSRESQLTGQLPKTGLELVSVILDELKNKRWLSTQERLSLFKLAKVLQSNKNVNDRWSLMLNRQNSEKPYQQANDFIKVWSDEEAKESFSVTNSSEKPLYVDLKVQGYLSKAEPSSNGIRITRHYYDTSGQKIDLKNIYSGDMLLVHVEVNLDKQNNHLPDTMLVELLPAGLELENQNLPHAMKITDLKIGKQFIHQWQRYNQVNHQEYRDDRFVTAFALSRYQPSHLFYLARAVTPGTYVVPPTLVEDMYRPEIRAVGATGPKMVIKE